jgi:hypothetical protein
MFFHKPKAVICAVCGKPIEPGERRFAEKNRVTKVERHTHVGCHKAAGDIPGRVQ